MTGRTATRRLAVGAAVLCGIFWGVAHAGQWPIPPVPDNAYAVVRPSQNPLVKPNAKVPVPTIVWEKVRVRKDHPRLWLTRENREQFTRRLRGHPSVSLLQEAMRRGDPLALAFMYQITGRKAYARKAIEVLLEGKAGARVAPFLFDWTYEEMTEQQRREAVERLWALIQIDRASGWPRCSPYTTYPDDPRPSETPPDRWSAFYNWTFHDQDWARDQANTLFALIAIAHHHPRAEEGVRNFWEYSLKDAALFLDHLRDGSYWQGYYWFVTAKAKQMCDIFTAMKTACGIDYVDPKTHPYLANLGRWVLYCSDPWRRRVIYNYGDGFMPDLDGRARIALLASSALARDPHLQWLLREACPDAAYWHDEIRYYDHNVVPQGPSTLPLARAFPGTNLVVMRSAWDAGALWASVQWMDWFDMHCHGDAGSFILYCKSPLAPDSGYYCNGALHKLNYYTRTVAHNTLTVRDPQAKVPLNDGCQRLRDQRTWTWAVGAAAWLYHQEVHDRGDLLAFEHQALYDYCAGEAAMAYRREHLKEFVRQCVFLRDGVFVVFDRVETPRADLEKRWLLHLVGEPRIGGKLLRAHVKGHIEDYDAGPIVSRGNGGAILHCHTLLPAQRRVRKVGGVISDVPTSALVRAPRTQHRMGTGSRWHWSDPLILYYNDPLTGKKQPAICLERDSPTIVEYEISKTQLYMKFDAYERGRVQEIKLDLADYKTILDLVYAIGRERVWHVALHYLPGYQCYNEGMNYAPAYLFGERGRPHELAPQLYGAPDDHGSWRVEVYPAKPATRDYFLHVIRVLPAPGAEEGSVRLSDSPDRAETTIVLGDRVYTIAFAKTGDVGGRIRVTDAAGKVLANAPFATEVLQKPWW